MKVGNITTDPMPLNQKDLQRWYVFTGDSYIVFESLDEALKCAHQLRAKQSNNKNWTWESPIYLVGQ